MLISSLLSLLSDSEGMAMCEIVHTKSESEGRPERTFQLCCRYDWSSTRCTILNTSFCFYQRFCGFVQPAVLQTLRRTSWKQSTPSSGRSSAGSSWRQSLYHPTSSTSRLEANDFLLWKGHGQAWTEQVTKLTCPESSYTINTTFQR